MSPHVEEPRSTKLATGAAVLATLIGHGAPDGAAGVPDCAGADGINGMTVACDRDADVTEKRAARCGSTATPLAVDPGVVARAVALLRELPRSASRTVVAHGDFNPGNVLRSARRSTRWLAIDPKARIGDPAYDPWPLLSQIGAPFELADPAGALRERTALVAAEVGLDASRIAAWELALGVRSAFWSAECGPWALAQIELDRAYLWAALS